MIRILVIVFVYGGGLFLFAWLVDKYFAKWILQESRKPQPRIVFRDDGDLAQKKEPFCMSAPGQKAVRFNIRAAGLDKDRKQVS